MKPTVGLDQCIVLFLSAQPSAVSTTQVLPIERFEGFTKALAVPYMNLALRLTELDRIEVALHDVLKRREQDRIDKLVIAGGNLASDVTIISMVSLALGFDVYVLGDMLGFSDDAYVDLYWTRLVHAGVVPTTLVQMIAEWLASEAVAEKRARIQSTAERFGLIGLN
jgi:nicotinamidase-related amidase